MKKVLLFILLLNYSPVTLSQAMDTTHILVKQIADTAPGLVPLHFEEEILESLRKDPEFDYSEASKEENWWTRFKRALLLQWNQLMNWIFGDIESSGFLIFIVTSLPYLLLLGVLFLLVYLFARINPAATLLSSEHEAAVVLNEEEHIVRNLDIAELILKAVASGDYRLAVRYHFLHVLQMLSEKGYVIYDPSKTDEDYLDELKNGTVRGQFRKLNRIYDFIWYGQFETGGDIYQRIEKEFSQMENELNEQDL